MPSEGGNKPGPTIDNPAHASHVPEWKKAERRQANERAEAGEWTAGAMFCLTCKAQWEEGETPACTCTDLPVWSEG